MSSGSSCSGTEACRQPCPRDERHPDRSADSQSAQSDPARPSTTGLPQARHRPSPRPGAKAQQQPHKAAPQHRQGEPKGRSDRPLRPAPIPGTPLRVAPDPKAQSRQAKSQTPLCPSHAALEARPNSLISQQSSQYERIQLPGFRKLSGKFPAPPEIEKILDGLRDAADLVEVITASA